MGNKKIDWNELASDTLARVFWPFYFLLLASILYACHGPIAQAESSVILTEEVAVNCIVGEAENQGIEGMRAHASALRNRGHVKGVYGCKSPRLKVAPAWVFDQARQAWDDSAEMDYVDGADHFGAVGLDGKWIARMEATMVFTVQVKDVRFYKESKKGGLR